MLSSLLRISSAKAFAFKSPTFEAFVSVVLVNEDIVCAAWSVTLLLRQGAMRAQLTALILAGRQRGRREGKALHLCRLRQQWPSGRLWHAVGLYCRSVLLRCWR